MTTKIKAQERDRDDEYGIIRKEITVFNIPPFETPIKCAKNLSTLLPSIKINEITKRVSTRTIESFQKGFERPRDLRSRFIPNKLNLTILELMFDSIPDQDKMKSLANYWYASSEYTLFLPTAKAALLKEGKMLSEKRISDYIGLLRYLVELTESIGNFKAFIGTIPLLPIKFSRPFIKLYLEKGITAFAVDIGTKDLLNHIGDFRSILTDINEVIPLNKTFMYACNLGIPQFETDWARADDFLSLFAYVDAFGNTFKTKGGYGMPRTKPRAKRFIRRDLFYQLLPEIADSFNEVNQREQIKEADLVRSLIGVEKMHKYLETKKAVDKIAMKHLEMLPQKVKVA